MGNLKRRKQIQFALDIENNDMVEILGYGPEKKNGMKQVVVIQRRNGEIETHQMNIFEKFFQIIEPKMVLADDIKTIVKFFTPDAVELKELCSYLYFMGYGSDIDEKVDTYFKLVRGELC